METRLAARRDTPAMSAVRMFLSPEVPGERCLLVLLGLPDASKSYALAWLCLQLGGRWVDGETFVDAWMRDRAALLRAPCVVVDDVGRGTWTRAQSEAQAEALDAMIKLKCAAGQVVALAANFSEEGLSSFWQSSAQSDADAARWSRLCERLLQHGVPVDKDAAMPGIVFLDWLGMRRREVGR